MSNKNEKSQNEEVFTIDLEGFSDSSDIPGVTKLLNPAKAAEKAAAAEKAKRPEHVPSNEIDLPEFTSDESNEESVIVSSATPPPILGKQNLKDLSVLFEVKFAMQGGSFCFQEATPHAESSLQDWQKEIFNGMKFDVEAAGFRAPFQELRYETFGFLYNAFAAHAKHFIQVVQVPSAPYLHVLISSQSLANQKDSILSILHSPVNTGEIEANDSAVIELDLTG
jgi:hypothetical protein